MTHLFSIETPRLLLRPWNLADLPVFAELTADKEVMRFFPETLTTEESNQLAQGIMVFFAEKGWGLWAVEEKKSRAFMGYVGLNIPKYPLPCSPCVEIGWRLKQCFWNKGYATEAANASLYFAFSQLNPVNIDEIIAFTATSNIPSQNVMKKIGMTFRNETFEHPMLNKNHPLSVHVLYRISKEQWQSTVQSKSQNSFNIF